MSQPIEILLDNGFKIVSGWIDEHDPEALPAGDYLSVEDSNGTQVFYADAADILADPLEGRRKLNAFIQACQGVFEPWH